MAQKNQVIFFYQSHHFPCSDVFKFPVGHWGGGGGSSGSDWGSNKSDNGPGPQSSSWGMNKKDDTMWSDRESSSNQWGGPPSGPPPNRSNSATEIGTWGSDNRSSGPGSWGDEGGASTWNKNGPAPGSMDNGTALWGDPKGGKGGPDRPPWAQPKGWGDGPKNDAPKWGQDVRLACLFVHNLWPILHFMLFVSVSVEAWWWRLVVRIVEATVWWLGRDEQRLESSGKNPFKF